MKPDIFDVLETAGFGSNVHEVAAEGECRVLRLDDESGEGFMTMYRLFDGIYLMYNDFHLKSCSSEYQNAETVLCIDHCREGRIEHENPLGGRYYMEAGDMRIDKRVHHEGRVELPLSHYHGVTIGFMQDTAQASLRRALPFLSVELSDLAEKFCGERNEFLIRDSEQLNALFMQLYHAPKSMRTDYFRIKTAELLILLNSMDAADHTEQRQYIPASISDKIKEVHSLMTSDLERIYTVEELSEISGMTSAALRKGFKAVYGLPIYKYIKGYKMKAAAAMLISEQKLNISEIAQRLGYDNSSKFSAAFRDVMGVTPQNYRNRQEVR